MPRLETTSGWPRFISDLRSLSPFSPTPPSSRLSILKSLLLRSVRLTSTPPSSSLSTPPLLPLRIRPFILLLTIFVLILLGLLGFHPSASLLLSINDKLLHFVCFFLATALFYLIWDVDEPARSSYLWRNASLILTLITCFVVGGVGSEIVQGMLPYKVFQLGDIVANLLGAGGGLFFAWHGEKRWRARRELERLYAPLDSEEYGDLDLEEGDEEEELETMPRVQDGGGALKSSLKQTGAGGGSGIGGKKKARFGGGEIWDDSVDDFGGASSSVGGNARRREDLFSIDDDDEDDEDEGGKTKANANTAPLSTGDEDVWKQADK
ncbi:uncharacterized protein UHOD_04310 [Ustilago sp. UG-2017b]|nr:uncharacterized protein UHOD_04310 [Ustilago sp. UG-2017b]